MVSRAITIKAEHKHLAGDVPLAHPPTHPHTTPLPYFRMPVLNNTKSQVPGLAVPVRHCENEEVQCGQEDGEGVKECITRIAYCDGVPNCSNNHDKVYCFAITRDFRQPLGQTFQT